MITKEEVLNIADLSKLYLSEEEMESTVEEIGSMVKFVDQINSMEDSFCETSSKCEICNALRKDVKEDSPSREKILKNANGGKDGFFYLDKSK